jgi:hypothetical protein
MDDLNSFDPTLSDAVPGIAVESLHSRTFIYVDLRNFRTQVDLSLNNPSFKDKIISVAARCIIKSVIDLLSDDSDRTHRKTIPLA